MSIVKYTSMDGVEQRLSPQIVRDQLVDPRAEVTDQEIGYFLALCEAQQLNPFIKDAYLIKYRNRPAQVVTSKDAFFKRAEAHEAYRGFEAGVTIVDKEGVMRRREGSMVLAEFGEQLVGGWAKVHRAGYAVPVFEEVSFTEYTTGMSTWLSIPGTMIRKVALVHALREAFPQSLQGLYTSEEMAQAAPEGEDLIQIEKEITDIELEHEPEPEIEVERYEHDMSPVTELKNRLAAAKNQSDREAGKDLIDKFVTMPFDHMTPEQFDQFLKDAELYVVESEQVQDVIPF